MAGVTRWRMWRETIGAVVSAVTHAVRRRRGEKLVVLQPGDVAPPFELPGSDGRVYRLADMRGHTVVLAWFPKAFTGG
jgi:hypothetical protein